MLYNFALGLKTLKWIVLAPDLPIWKCRNPRRKPENGRNGHFSFLKGSGGKFQVRRFIFSLNALYYTPEHLCEVTQLNSNMTHYLYTLLWPVFFDSPRNQEKQGRPPWSLNDSPPTDPCTPGTSLLLKMAILYFSNSLFISMRAYTAKVPKTIHLMQLNSKTNLCYSITIAGASVG